MTVVQLGELLGMSQKSLQPWFTNGKSHYLPSTSTVRRIIARLERKEEGLPSTNLDLFNGMTSGTEFDGRPEEQSVTTSLLPSDFSTDNTHSSTVEMPAFKDSQHFQDEVYGEIFLSPMEKDLIDTPEFQRLFRISQLGFINLVYQCANHNRGQHSIGVCETAKRLVEHLNKNSKETSNDQQARLDRTSNANGHNPLPPRISPSEAVLIRLGALLHDIPHAPYSHDIEKKTHLVYKSNIDETPFKSISYYGGYEKHDDLDVNPTFYIAVFDYKKSVLARVLRHYSPHFWEMLLSNANDPQYKGHLAPFIQAVEQSGWGEVANEILQNLLFHLMAFEKPSDGINDRSLTVADRWDNADIAHTKEWGLGPSIHSWEELHRHWYQPFRYDIVGNTLSADLLDYLQRDLKRLGINRGMDLNLLNHYVLAPIPDTFNPDTFKVDAEPGQLFRCAIDLNDYKRGTIREYLLNDVFRLLDLRHEIHEKAVNHRVVHAAVAMLSRALLQLQKVGKKPPLKEIVATDRDCSAIYGEESFLGSLIKLASDNPGSMEQLNSLSQKIAERRIYRPLMIIPGDVAVKRMLGLEQVESNEVRLRRLAAIVDSELFSPFFLFLSNTVEAYLQHGFEEANILWDYINKTASKDCTAQNLKVAMNFVPKRVIISATPYKQLYKDPALVVRVRDTVKQIDELENHLKNLDSLPEIATRISAAMEDTEQRYAGMWKLFVFISDGLYYTGTMAKLVPNYKCGMRIDAHEECLEFAQRFLIMGFKTAYEYWMAKQEAIEPRTLNSPLEPDEFQSLLRTFLAMMDKEEELHAGIQEEVSGIYLKWYLHGEETDNCKDVRYKFDPRSSLNLEEISRGADNGRAAAARALLAFGISNDRLLERETIEFFEKYQAATPELKDRIDTAVKIVEEDRRVTGSRYPEPSSSLIAATHALLETTFRGPE